MEQSPAWEANWFSASQGIPHILWYLKVHYCIHTRTVHTCIILYHIHTIMHSTSLYNKCCPKSMVQLGAAPSDERWVALLHQNMVRGAYACSNSQTSTCISILAVIARCLSRLWASKCGSYTGQLYQCGGAGNKSAPACTQQYNDLNSECDCHCVHGTCDEEENISMWCKASKKPQFFWLQTTNAMCKALSMNVNIRKQRKPEYILTFH